MTDLIQIHASNPAFANVTRSDTYGGVTYLITEGYEMREMLEWFKKYKDQQMKESKAREQFESVAVAYESYQTALKLVADSVV